MQRKTKGVLVGAGFLTLLGLGWRASRAKAAPPGGEQVAATVGLEILDMAGNPVPKNSPATVVEGSTYTLRTTVTNKSTKSGVAVGVNLAIQPWGGTDATPMTFSPNWFTAAFGAGVSYLFDSVFTVPAGSGGKTGQIGAYVFDPSNNIIAQAGDTLTIQSVAIVYGATVTIGLV